MPKRRLLVPFALVTLLTATLGSCGGGGDGDGDPIAGVRSFPAWDEATDHKHFAGPIEYPPEPAPPNRGRHLGRWLACGVYDEEVPNEAAVHSMEHGAVWLTYQPSVAAAAVTRLRALADVDPDYVLVSPFAAQQRPIVASAWGLQLAVDDAGDPRLRAFVKRYADGAQGGEPNARCSNGVSPDEARAVIANPPTTTTTSGG